jgi:hypothetical protein
MRATPYALSVHHFISSVGADAGFAAIIGVAVLVLLLFIHARETANLRRRADEAQDALHRLEQYVDQIGRAGVAPAASPAPAPPAPAPSVAAARAASAGRTVAPPPAPAPVGMMTASPAAPAGVGAPALSAATRLIPVADEGTISVRSNRSATVVERVAAATALVDPPGPPPSTAAGGANGSGLPPVAPPPSVGQSTAGRERLPLRPNGRAAAAPAPAPASRRRRGGASGGSRVSRGAIVIAGALLVVIIVGVLLVVTNSGGSGSSGATRTTAHHAAGATKAATGRTAKTRATTAVTPSAVTVAVLNGTSTSNLAHDISQKLSAAGYKPGSIATATDQTQSSTIVGYLPNDKRDALAVAKALKLRATSVQAVDSSNRTVACNGSAATCSAQVVVTVGSDLATNG